MNKRLQHESILDIARKFDETGSVQDKPRSGRPRSVSTEKNKERVLAAFEKSPGTSAKRASLELNLSRTSLQRMMKELELKPYRLRLLHTLNRMILIDAVNLLMTTRSLIESSGLTKPLSN